MVKKKKSQPPKTQSSTMRARVKVSKAQLAMDAVVGHAFQKAMSLQDRHDPCVVPGPAAQVQAGLGLARKCLRQEMRDLLRELKTIDRSVKRWLLITDLKQRDRRIFTQVINKKFSWCRENIAMALKGGLSTIRVSGYWARWFGRQSIIAFSFFPDLPEIKRIFSYEDQYNIAGVVVPLRIVKIDLTIFGLSLNIGYLRFPTIGGDTPPPIPLLPARSVERRGVTLHALDTIGVKNGNVVLPPVGGNRTVRFYGYGKILFGENIPENCRLKFQQVRRGRVYVFLNGAQEWIEEGRQFGSDVPIADPPGMEEYPLDNFGPNIDGMVDLPSTDNDTLPFGSYVIRDELFRTWITLVCTYGPTTLLGYWEWSFRAIWLVASPGGQALEAPPPGVPTPPGGWPDPGSGPTRWRDAADADPQAARDFRDVF
ncbi:hypothetical protein ACFL6O_05035 [candidate division KSB1 bacterium]